MAIGPARGVYICVICDRPCMFNAYLLLWHHVHFGSHDHFDHVPRPANVTR